MTLEDGAGLVAYEQNGAPCAGVVIGDELAGDVDALSAVAGVPACATVADVVAKLGRSEQDRLWETARRALATSSDTPTRWADLRLLPPISSPDKIICIGLNYQSTLRISKRPVPEEPIFFTKFASNLVGHGGMIRVPAVSNQLLWEGEVAVVVGSTLTGATVSQAARSVAGVMAFNDVTAFDLFNRPAWGAQRGKAADTFAPCGPLLRMANSTDELDNLRLMTKLNGDVVQDDRTSGQIFSIAEVLAFLSQTLTLLPGDIVATGTPAGSGVHMNPVRFLTPGDVVDVTVEGVGTLSSTVVG